MSCSSAGTALFVCSEGWLSMKWQGCEGYCWAVAINWTSFIFKQSYSEKVCFGI